MIFEHSSKYKKTLLFIFLFILAGGVFVFLQKPNSNEANKIPEVVEKKSDNLWQRYNKDGLSFQYPEKLTTQYIFVHEWPPVVEITTETYYCKITPQEVSGVSEITSQRMVDDRIYCVNVKHEGAAGSVYSSYIYTTARNNELVKISFTLRYPNCNNYYGEQNMICSSEREAFDMDAIVDRIVQTIPSI
ncbi:MAG: hypothetical protein WCS88_04625 [Patescibacteria group bacterium]|jgi:hypothetical protein